VKVSQLKTIEEIYQLYKDQLTGDEDDAVIIISSLLSELTREELYMFIEELSRDELYDMLGSYMIKKLWMRIAKDSENDLERTVYDETDRSIH
jgi:hypothetical protein